MKKVLSVSLSLLMTLGIFNPFVSVLAEENSGDPTVETSGEHTTESDEQITDDTVTVLEETEDDVETHEHQFSEPVYEWNEDATVLSASRKCIDESCDYSEAENAVINEQVISEPTCVETGVKVITGTFENTAFEPQTIQESIPVVPHQLVKTDKTDRMEEYWTCSVCGKQFSDAEGQNEVSDLSVLAVEIVPEISLEYSAHVANIGWQNYVSEGNIAGTTGRSLQMEALKIRVDSNLQGSIQYRAHVKNIGWQNTVGEDETAGTTGRSLQMEAIEISLTGELAEYYDIYYRVHSMNLGWLGWAKNGERAGTQGYGYRAEAIEIRAIRKGESAPVQDQVSFRRKDGVVMEISNRVVSADTLKIAVGETASLTASADYVSWGSAVKDIYASSSNEYCSVSLNPGRSGDAYNGHVETAITVTGVADGFSTLTVVYPDNSTKTVRVQTGDNIRPELSYSAHVKNIGWQNYVAEGDTAGTTGRALRLEALKINLDHVISGGIEYATHVQNIGWTSYVSQNQVSGTTGRSLQVEAVSIRLTGALAEKYDIYYRVHSSGYGWLGWTCNGAYAGTEGYSKQAEAIQIRLVDKGAAAPGSTANPYYKAVNRSIPYYNQKDPRWASMEYGGNTIGHTGCGTCAYAMIFSSLLNRTVLPPDVASYLYSVGEYNTHRPEVGIWGTTGKSHQAAASHWGVHCDVLHSWEEVVAALQANKILSICVGPGRFINSGSHELVMYGRNINSVMVYDPLTRAFCHNYTAFEVYQERSTSPLDMDAGGVVYAFY